MNEEKMETKNNRKTIFIDKVSQSKYAAVVVLYFFIYTAILITLVYLPTMLVLGNEASPLDRKIQASREFFFLEERYLPVMLLVMVLMGLHSIRMSHKIFGPVYRFKMTMRKIVGGEINQKVFLRKGDYLKDMAQEFNIMIDSLSGRFLEISTSNLRCRLILSELAQDMAKEGVANRNIDSKLEELKKGLEEMGKIPVAKREENR